MEYQLEEAQLITEGFTKLFVPKLSLTSNPPPKKPVFFNPLGRFSRSVGVIIYRALSLLGGAPRIRLFCDLLAGVGSRGLRLLNEARAIESVVLNDWNQEAINYARASAKENGLLERCTLSIKDAKELTTSLASQGGVDAIDIDPFGSPSPFIWEALKALRKPGLLSVTATDTAVLCGPHGWASPRKYKAKSLRTEYSKDIGVRVLLGFVSLSASLQGFSIEPLFSHIDHHYIRVYIMVKEGKREQDSSIGYVSHCFNCGNRSLGPESVRACRACGGDMESAGPLWISSIHDASLVEKALSVFDVADLRRIRRLLEIALGEAALGPTYYNLDYLAKRLKVSSLGTDRTVRLVRDAGFRASRTVLDPRGIRTDAPYEVLKELILSHA